MDREKGGKSSFKFWTCCFIPILDVVLIKLKGPRMPKNASGFGWFKAVRSTRNFQCYVYHSHFGLTGILLFLLLVNIKSFAFFWYFH